MGLIGRKARWFPEEEQTPLMDCTVGKLLENQSAKYPSHVAVQYISNEQLNIPAFQWTYKEYEEKARDVAKGLLAAGYRKGDHVAVWAINVPEWLLLQMGAAKIGVVLVTMNPALLEEEASYILRVSDAKGVFVLSTFRGRSYTEELRRICKNGKAPALKQIITFDNVDGFLSFDELINNGQRKISEQRLIEHENQVKAHDFFQIQFTSGTTGFPKGALLTHYNAVNNAMHTFKRWNIEEGDRVCSPIPLFHTAGSILLALGTLSVGATFTPMPYFDPSHCMRAMKELRITHFGGVPTMLQATFSTREQVEPLALRQVMSGGSPVPPNLLERIEKQFHAKTVVLMGMTETSPVYSTTAPSDSQKKRWETCGRPLPHVELRIVDPDTREIVNCGEPGEIEVRGYMVMAGYYKMDQETRETFSEDGWLKTGDIGMLDEEGYLHVKGRIKDMIIRGGENIYPQEIENFLLTHPSIEDAQVVGIPDDYYGEVAVAIVKVRVGSELTEEEVKQYCRGKISHQKIPAMIRFVDSYPLTASGKVQKRLLREQLLKELKMK